MPEVTKRDHHIFYHRTPTRHYTVLYRFNENGVVFGASCCRLVENIPVEVDGNTYKVTKKLDQFSRQFGRGEALQRLNSSKLSEQVDVFGKPTHYEARQIIRERLRSYFFNLKAQSTQALPVNDAAVAVEAPELLK